MGKVSKASAANTVLQGPVEDHNEDVHGYTINFLTFSEDIDGAALLKGLPGDQCHCPHWGYVLKGTFGFRFEDREESYGPGDAFYAPPGHVPTAAADTELVMFSPADALKATDEAITRNLEAMGHPATQ
jgi:quercetin dioxygenase-like cupin family protein